MRFKRNKFELGFVKKNTGLSSYVRRCVKGPSDDMLRIFVSDNGPLFAKPKSSEKRGRAWHFEVCELYTSVSYNITENP